MNFTYLTQTEDEVLDSSTGGTKKNLKDPVSITISIEVERSKYMSIKEKAKVPISEKVMKIFK